MSSLLMPPHDGSPRKPGQTISARRSTSSLRPEAPDNAPRVSLAHELAAAMMPEPNLTSQMLAEEFGIEFDDGGEGEEGDDLGGGGEELDAFGGAVHQDDPFYGNGITESRSLGDEWGIQEDHDIHHVADILQSKSKAVSTKGHGGEDDWETTFGGGAPSFGGPQSPQASQSPLELLAQNLQATDLFIEQLRRVDAEPTSATTAAQLETSAASLIGRLNDIARERESQVRMLQEYDREFKKISAEVDGNEVLGALEAMEHVQDLLDPSEKSKDSKLDDEYSRTPTALRVRPAASDFQTPSARRHLSRVDEEDDFSNERALLGGDGYDDEQDESYNYDIPSPGKFRKGMDLPPAPPQPDVPSPSSTLPHLSHLRTLTQSFATTLTSLSEHAQVNGVNTADAGRKLRALKNKIVELKADWDSADRSRHKIERWEAGLIDDLTTIDSASDGSSPELSFSAPSSRDTSPGPETPELTSGPRLGSRRIDGRKLVEEQLRGFQLALAEAASKTEKIMATRN